MFIHTHTRIDSFPVLKVPLASNFLPRVLVLSCPPSSLEEWRQVGKGEGKRGFKVDGGWGEVGPTDNTFICDPAYIVYTLAYFVF